MESWRSVRGKRPNEVSLLELGHRRQHHLFCQGRVTHQSHAVLLSVEHENLLAILGFIGTIECVWSGGTSPTRPWHFDVTFRDRGAARLSIMAKEMEERMSALGNGRGGFCWRVCDAESRERLLAPNTQC